jgi:hypothetical protein
MKLVDRSVTVVTSNTKTVNISVTVVKNSMKCGDFLLRLLKMRCLLGFRRVICKFHGTSCPLRVTI